MIRVGKMQINDDVKKWSYSKIEKVFGDKADEIAKAVGVKKTSSKKSAKKSDED